MGIPLFFKTMSSKYDNIVLDDIKNNNNALFFDLNCLVHPCARRIVEHFYTKDKNKLESKICIEVNCYIKKIVEIVDPKFIYIAIDGVAPFAKMTQQRTRRFKTILEKKEINTIRKKEGMEETNQWDTNAISPGTEFMKKLSLSINQFINTDVIFSNIDVIFSDSSEPGEGEHKIIHFIKLNTVPGNIIVYGLDADLIMLSLTCGKDKIYLLREQITAGKVDENKFIYVTIDILKKNLINDFIDRFYIDQKCANIEIKHDIISDYVFICFFLGNDFLPHILSLDLRHQGLDIIMDIYIYIYNLLGEPFTQNRTINTQFLKLFIKKLSEIENKTVTDIFTKRGKQNKYFKIRADTEYDRKLELLNNKPILDMEKEFTITRENHRSSSWRNRYNYHCLKADTQHEIDTICHNYLEGIHWTHDYYFKTCPSWLWKYDHLYAPTLYDLNRYMESHDIMFNFKKDKPVKPEIQLLCILPKNSINLLPKKYQKYMVDINCGLLHLYPEKYELSYYFKRYYWECVPILPPITKDLIKLIV
jgi:5'-3' exoribonuclease 2